MQLLFAETLNKSKKSVFDKLNSSWQCSYHFYCTTAARMHFRLYQICHIYKQLIMHYHANLCTSMEYTMIVYSYT